MSTEVKVEKSSLTGALRRSMNAVLVQAMDLEAKGQTEEISFGEILGNMDASSYLVVFIALVITLMFSVVFGMRLLNIWPNAGQLVVAASLPAILFGFGSCLLLFQLRRWLKALVSGASPRDNLN